VAKLEGTQAHHFTNYIELSQRVKTTKLLLSTTNQAKSILDNQVQTWRSWSKGGLSWKGVWQALENEWQAHQTLKDKPLPPQGYDDALDQWVLDEPKIRFSKFFIRIGKLITTKSYSSMKDSLTKAL